MTEKLQAAKETYQLAIIDIDEFKGQLVTMIDLVQKGQENHSNELKTIKNRIERGFIGIFFPLKEMIWTCTLLNIILENVLKFRV